MLSRTRSKCSPSVTILLVKCWHWFISHSDHSNDWTRKIFQWLIQKYFNQCPPVQSLFLLSSSYTNKSWRKIFQWLKQKYFNHNRNNTCYKIPEKNDVKKSVRINLGPVLIHQSEDSNFNSQELVIKKIEIRKSIIK